MSDRLVILEAPFDPARLRGWAKQVRAEYDGWEDREDNRGPALLARIAEEIGGGMLQGMPLVVCLDGDKLVGLLAYQVQAESCFYNLQSFAVAPKLQRQGIGSRLLAYLKQLATEKGYFILAGGVLPPAIGCLKRAGFRLVRTCPEEPIYKWSTLSKHAGDDFPGKDEEELTDG
jgi:GNAT superfamily N-acetyltransferase